MDAVMMAPPGAGVTGTTPAAASGADTDFETFLRMLTTQLRHQDPTRPMDPGDLASQLATFSGVEQQMLTNRLLGTLGERMGLLGMAQLSGWIGMEVRSDAPVRFDGAPVRLVPEPEATADSAVLVVRNAIGAEVARVPVPVAGGEMDWAGTDAADLPLASGLYTFVVESHAAGQLLATTPVEHYALVREARSAPAGGEVTLLTDGGASLPASAVTALRRPL